MSVVFIPPSTRSPGTLCPGSRPGLLAPRPLASWPWVECAYVVKINSTPILSITPSPRRGVANCCRLWRAHSLMALSRLLRRDVRPHAEE
eukprot:scaffold36083_cov112-Isochrysis_galbana.AAC.2